MTKCHPGKVDQLGCQLEKVQEIKKNKKNHPNPEKPCFEL
jgi:hypothetical protein